MDSTKYKLRYLPLFYEDLEQKMRYISEKLNNPKAANDLIDAVKNKESLYGIPCFYFISKSFKTAKLSLLPLTNTAIFAPTHLPSVKGYLTSVICFSVPFTI